MIPKCERDGFKLRPCKFLDELGLGETMNGERVKGMRPLVLISTADRSIPPYPGYVSYSKSSKDKGVVLNFCPWCGAAIGQDTMPAKQPSDAVGGGG